MKPILLQVILIALNAVFASMEIAVLSMNEQKIKKQAENGNKASKRLLKLTEKPSRFLATIQIAITLSGFLGSAFAAESFAKDLGAWFLSVGLPASEKTAETIAVVGITLILSYFTLIFGELVPKRAAMKYAEKLAMTFSGLITFLSAIFAPIVWVLTISTNGILRLFGIDPNSDEDEVTEEEIRMMVDAGSEKGAIDAEEKTLIQNVFEFDDLTADEIATHRTDAALLWMEESIEEWEKTIHESRHSIYPVCDESVDHVVGILNAKDFFRFKEEGREMILKNAVKPAYFVPDSIKADVLFRNMKKTGNNFAIVCDEYGGMSGIITMNDLVQELVGDFDDGEKTDPEIERQDSNTWKIKGSAAIDDVEKALSVKLPEEEYDTFGGLVFASYGAVPEDGSTFEIDVENLHVKALEVKDHRLIRSIVCVMEKEQKEDGEES